MPIPDVLLEAFDAGSVVDDAGRTVPLDSNVALSEARRLYDLVRDREPDVSIEIGLAQGISALAIAQALQDNGHGTHYVIDPFQAEVWGGAGLAGLKRAGLHDRVVFHECFPEEIVPSLPRAGFAFIDASHLFDLTILDFVLVDKRLDVGGIVGFHDLWMDSLVKALRYIVTNRAYQVHEDTPSRGPSRVGVATRVVRRVPKVRRALKPEVLDPSVVLGLERNLTFLEKLADDDRDWRYHRPF